jgi:hypothetical protein
VGLLGGNRETEYKLSLLLRPQISNYKSNGLAGILSALIMTHSNFKRAGILLKANVLHELRPNSKVGQGT